MALAAGGGTRARYSPPSRPASTLSDVAKTKVPIEIITCPEWDAKPAKAPPIFVPKSVRIIFHHTAAHHREIANPANESYDEFVRFLRDIQDFHMRSPNGRPPGRGWNDSGQNFTVGRNGMIGQGRWFTVSAIQNGRMVSSAHTLGDNGRPSQNDQIGIEHEHSGTEPITAAQLEASARLMAWVAGQYGRTSVLQVFPHSRYSSTSCPANLIEDIGKVKTRAQVILNEARL